MRSGWLWSAKVAFAILVTGAFVSLTACGGGGGGGTGGGVAAVKGTLLTLDGSTANLGGVRFYDPNTGRTATTASNGSFDLGVLPAGTITLRLLGGVAGRLATANETGEGGGEDEGSETADDSGDDSGDETDDGVEDGPEDDLNDDSGDDANDQDESDDGDDNDVGDDDFDVTGVQDGETIEVRVSVSDGRIESLEISRSGHDERESEVHLRRSADSDDPDVEGEAEAVSRVDRERIRVKAEHVDAGRELEWFVILPDASAEESQGTATANLEGEARWEVDTSLGDTLPFGVTSVADLEGYGIEVRDATDGTVLLFGTFAAIPDSVDDDEDGTESHGSALLTPAAGVSGEAQVEIESETDEAKEEFEVEVEGSAVGQVIEVWLEDPSNLGTLTNVGSFTVGGEGEGKFERDTHDGDTLPYGVASVSELVGLAIELRDGADGTTVLFSGLVPSMVSDD